MEKLRIVSLIVVLIAVGIMYVWVLVRNAKKRRQEELALRNKVVARVKEQRDSIWVCKFFLYGNKYGFFRQKPHSDRVEAIVIKFDNKLGMYELQELA